jgi:hypothetical protein
MMNFKFLFLFFLLSNLSFGQGEEDATIYFAHLGKNAKMFQLPVFHEASCIGAIESKETIVYRVNPGTQSFSAVWPDTQYVSTLIINAEPGKSYFIVCDLKGGAYQMDPAGFSGELVHKFMNNISNDPERVAILKKYTKRTRKKDWEVTQGVPGLIQHEMNISRRQKSGFEDDYAYQVLNNIELMKKVYGGEFKEQNEQIAKTMEQYQTPAVNTAAVAETDEKEKAGGFLMNALTNGIVGAITGNTPEVNSTSDSFTETNTEDAPADNRRESIYQEMLEMAESDPEASSYLSSNTNTPVTDAIYQDEEVGKIRDAEDNEEASLKYRRSSLYTLMINDVQRQHFGVIRDAFGNFEMSSKFNEHNIGPYLISADGGEKDQSEIIADYLNENGVARQLVAKWFNRDAEGNFDMKLVQERGSYNASDLDVLIAKNSKKGHAILADAGEELIGNTFVLVNDYKFVNKEEVANKASGWLKATSFVASAAGADGVALAADAVNTGAQIMGKGYVVKTTSYLYRLDWNEEVSGEFFFNLWTDANNHDPSRKKAFDESNLFKLKFVGLESAWADLQSTAFTKKSDQDLIRIATVRATDKGIAKLQKKYEEFRIKTPLFSGDPIASKIGTKEGVEKGDKFEVLEQVVDEDGRTRYVRVGKIKVGKQVWDNSYLSEEAEGDATSNGPEYTEFKGPTGKFYSGMLIRQIN